MDQSKWSLPRHHLVSTAKEFQKYVRPRVKLHAVWVHSIGLYLFVCSPGVSADGSMVLEALTLALEGAAERFRELSRPMPSSCLVWVTWRDFLLLMP
jgi:hypothetical protein